jgi:hypothetical protein
LPNPWGDELVEPETPAPNAGVNPWGDELVEEAPSTKAQSWGEWGAGIAGNLKEAFTGEKRTDPAYATQPEFGDAFRAQAGDKDPRGMDVIRNAIAVAQIAPTETGKLNILKSRIPGLEVGKDKFGAMVLKAPGMTEFAYFNKPGFSAQDVGEFGMQTIATAPFLGPAGAGTGILTRIGLGAGGMAAASAAQDTLAAGVGSEEGIDPTRAAVSAGVGGALPVVGAAARGVTAAVKYPLNRLQAAVNPDAAAGKAVQSAVAADRAAPRGTPLTAQEIVRGRAAGQDLRTMDLGGGEATRALARSAANQSPEARSMLLNVIDERHAGQGPRTAEFVNALVSRPGQQVNSDMTREALETAARSARKPLYDTAYKDGEGGLMTPILTRLAESPAVKTTLPAAMNTIKNRVAAGLPSTARGPNGYTLEFWDIVKRRLGDQEGKLKRSGAKSAALELGNIRRALTDELDTLVPSYKPARGTAESFFKANNALEAGENFVTGKFRMEAARRALAGMTPQERDLFSEGFASRFIETVRKTGDSRNILNAINASPAARERFTVALGPNRARSMEAFLRVEGIMDLMRNAVSGNSSTARQLVELGLLGAGGYSYSNEDPHGLLMAALAFGGSRANAAINRRVAERVAKMLLSDNPQQVMQGLKQVGSTPMLDALRNVDKALTRSGAGREVSQELAPTQQLPVAQPPAAAPAQQPPQEPRRLPMPPGPAVPTSGGGTGPRASLQAPDEAMRLAEQAIARGAPREQVMARLQSYLTANGLSA